MSWLHCSSVVVVVLWLLLPAPPQAAGHNNPPKTPILARLGKDPATSLYTISIKHGGLPLVVDLAGPLYWSRCPPAHRTIPCQSNVCQALNRNLPPSTCTYTAAYDTNYTDPNCACPAYPYNPINGACSITHATTFTLSAYGTDGANPMFPVTFMAVGACSNELRFDGTLPAGSWGVAGMSRLPQSLPTQVTSAFKVAKQFALCLPRSGGGSGAAIFGGGPFQLVAAPPVDLAADGLRQNQVPFLKYSQNGAYYLRVAGINVNNEPVTLPPGALDLNAGSGDGGVMLSTVAPYTTLRSDIYRALLGAFDAATSGIPRAPAVQPFDMCYQASALGVTRLGYAVVNIDLLLDDGRTWLIPGGSSLVQVDDHTVCFAFLEMTTISREPGSPAVLFGGFQLEDHLLLFDLDKETFAFSGPLAGIRTSCSNFNFTMGTTTS
jgi:hypothetical protein